MALVYSLGIAFLISTLLSFSLLFLILNEIFNEKYVPKVEKRKKAVNVEEIERLLSSHFELSEEVYSTSEGEGKSLPPPAELKLKGVIVSEVLKGAIFGDGKEIFVKEGGKIKDYKLEKVFPYGVSLSSGGKEYFLAFKPREAKGKRYVLSSTPYSHEIVISRREIEAITRDPAKMFTQIRLVPYVRKGKTEGFIFEWVKPGSVFSRLGIRRGDILVSINGMTITSGEDAFRILQMLRNEPNLKVVLIRRGRKEEINVRIE